MTEAKPKWQRDIEAREKKQIRAFEKLSPDQQQTIRQTQETLRDVLNMLTECHDLYLSDINKLNIAFWRLHNNFPTKDA